MESTSIFSLNDDCLGNILSHLTDFSSFYSFSLTCKLFNQLALSKRNWHINVLKRQADFYIRKFIVYNDEDRAYKSRLQLRSLLEKANRYCIDDLSYNDVLNVWKSCGPVAATFYSWIKSSNSVTRDEGPRETCSTEYAEQTFHLPVCGQDLSIRTSHFVDYIGNYDRETKLKVSCGDLAIENEVYKIIPEDYDYWDEQELRAVVDPMKPVIELLQKELGDTVPPITDKFFVWMCFRFPCLEEEHRIYFKDEAKNAMPSLESLQPLFELYRQNKLGRIKESLESLEKWLRENEECSSAKIIAHALEILVQKSQAAILGQLQEDVGRFPEVVFDYYLKKAPKKMMLDLVNRTTLFIGNYSAGSVADKYVDNKAHFRMKGGSVLKIDGGMGGDGASYPTWYELTLTFVLPDAKEIKIQCTDLMDTQNFQPLLDMFSPVTEILQECIDESMRDEENIPKIKNIFTLYYFLLALELSGVSYVFEDNCDQLLFECDEHEYDAESSQDSVCSD